MVGGSLVRQGSTTNTSKPLNVPIGPPQLSFGKTQL